MISYRSLLYNTTVLYDKLCNGINIQTNTSSGGFDCHVTIHYIV